MKIVALSLREHVDEGKSHIKFCLTIIKDCYIEFKPFDAKCFTPMCLVSFERGPTSRIADFVCYSDVPKMFVCTTVYEPRGHRLRLISCQMSGVHASEPMFTDIECTYAGKAWPIVSSRILTVIDSLTATNPRIQRHKLQRWICYLQVKTVSHTYHKDKQLF